MKRYIDTDILAKIVFDKWQECDELKYILPAVRNAVMNASTIDAVEIVRCKERKHSVKHQLGYGCGMNYHLATNGEWFCADGERREDAEIH